MFSKLKALVGGGKSKSQLDEVPRAELQDKPITLGLLIRAATEMDETNKYLDEAVGKRRQQLPKLPTLDDKVRSAVGVVAISIVDAAMKRAGLNLVDAMPGKPVPKEILMTFAFGGFVLSAITGLLRPEGFEIDIRYASVSLVSNLLLLHTDEEKVTVCQGLSSIMKGMLAAAEKHENVQEWISNNTKLVLGYLMQATTTDQKFKDINALDALGLQLKSALATAS